MRKLILGLALAAFLGFGVTVASASTITLTVGGALTSASADPGDAAFAHAAYGDAYSLVLTYDPAAFATTASLVFSDTTLGQSASLTNADGNYYLQSPGPGTSGTWFGFNDINGDYINAYCNGPIAGPGDVTGLNALTADNSASPSPFEWLFNIPSDGGQTDLQGSVNTISAVSSNPSAVPEPATLWLLAPGLLLSAFYERRRRAETRA